MNISYIIYEAERPKSMTEQREADAKAGEVAAAVARLGHSLRHPVTGKRSGRRAGRRPATANAARAVPRPRQPADR